jgi:hypothetical protein
LSPLRQQQQHHHLYHQQQLYHHHHQQLHHSPLHSRFNSPLLQQRHQVYPFDGCMGSLKTCDTGSNCSLYSQTTTVSSLADRQHCSYSEGVDGNLFKARSDVRKVLSLHLIPKG